MSRKNKDIFYHNQFYHIYNKVVSGTNLFVEPKDYWSFMERYDKYFSPYFKTYAYCLIPNHFHFIVEVHSSEVIQDNIIDEDTNAARNYMNGNADINFFIENQFSRCFSGLTMIYNKKYKRQGPLFKQGIKRVALNITRPLLQQMHYVHHNPKHYFLVEDIEQWPHSSYNAYLSDAPTQLPRNEVLELLGGREKYILFHLTEYNGDIDFD